MAVKDIIEIEPKGVPVEAPPPLKQTEQQKERTRGRFVPGRTVPSKQVKVAHRMSKSPLSLKAWARANKFDPDMVVRWFKNKSVGQ